jgi:hypothetical protein
LLTALVRGDQSVGALEVRDLNDTLVADGRYRFLMQLLRDWWLRFVVL